MHATRAVIRKPASSLLGFAFRDGMAVDARFGQPCSARAAPVQRIVYADNETNYGARCQTGGRLLADRALSRLLHDDWPKSIDDVE